MKEAGGYSVLKFSLGVNGVGKKRDDTTWYDCAVWGKRGETLHSNNLLFKGRHVTVFGRIGEVRAYMKRDGTPGASVSVSAADVDIGPRQGDDGQGSGGGGASGGNSGGGSWGSKTDKPATGGGWGGSSKPEPKEPAGGGWGSDKPSGGDDPIPF